MLKNYFVLDLSNVCHKAAEGIFFDHLHLDNPKAHFEVFTSHAELLTPLLRKYNLQGVLEITSIFVDQDSKSFYEQSCDKAFLRGFDYIAYFNHEYQSTEFINTQLEVPKRVYCVIFFLPDSPCFFISFKAGIVADINCIIIEADM